MKKLLVYGIMILMLAVSISGIAAADFDPQKIFGKSDHFVYNKQTGKWSWGTFYAPSEMVGPEKAIMMIGVTMEGDAEYIYAPTMYFYLSDPKTNRVGPRLKYVTVNSHLIGDFDIDEKGWQSIVVGPKAMKLIEQIINSKTLTLYYHTNGNRYEGYAENNSLFKDFKSELKRLVNSNWMDYFDSRSLSYFDRTYTVE